MGKKKINIILLTLIFISLIIILYGICIVYSYNIKIDNALLNAEIEINGEVVNENEEINDNINISENAIVIIIFKSGKKIAIYNNPTDYNLEKGAGKIVNNSILNKSGNSIILGHRDGSFSELKNINIDDVIEIKTVEKTVKYKVFKIYITDKDDPLPYKSSEDTMITLITCYPFVYVGNAPKRYVVLANVI